MARSTNTRANEAFELLKKGKHAEARDILEGIVREDRADAAVLETLGDVREHLGDAPGALDAYAGAVTHLRARGEGWRALGVIELMLIVDETSLVARCEAADLKRDLGDNEGCWREVVAAVESACINHDLAAAMAIVEDMADVVPDLAAAVAVVRRVHLHEVNKHDGARLARMLAESLHERGKVEDARSLLALASELQPTLKDVMHAKAVPADERTEDPWAEKTPEVLSVVSIDDDATDLDR